MAVFSLTGAAIVGQHRGGRQGVGESIGHARQQRLQVLAQLRMQLPHRRRELLAVRAHQLQRNVAAEAVEQQLQASGQHVFAQVQPGFVGDAFAGHRPAPHHVGVVADQRAAHRDHGAAPVDLERPAIVGAATELVDQAIVLTQFVQTHRRAPSLQVIGRRREHTTVAFEQGQGHVVGVIEVADADRHINRIAEHVGHFIGQPKVQAQPWMCGSECGQPRQQQVATKVRRCRQLQRAVQFGVLALYAGPPFAQGSQYLLRIRQVQRALAGQAQAAGGTHEQAQVQFAFQPRHGSSDLAG